MLSTAPRGATPTQMPPRKRKGDTATASSTRCTASRAALTAPDFFRRGSAASRTE